MLLSALIRMNFMGILIRYLVSRRPLSAWLCRFMLAVSMIVVPACMPPAYESGLAASLERELGAEQPELWSESMPGVIRYLDYHPREKKIALTLDACGSQHDSYDQQLVDLLIAEKIPSSLFINARWIDKYQEVFKFLAFNPLFDIQSHGKSHLPASVNGRSVYGIKGTANIR